MGNEIMTTEKPMSVLDVKTQVNTIQKIMESVMKRGTHYDTLPGCGNKPTLLKPGAEKIMMTFRLACDPEVEDLSTNDEIRFRVKTKLTARDGSFVGSGIGECSTNEEKYKWRRVVCSEEFEEASENMKRKKWSSYNGKTSQTEQIRTNPSDLANTVLKMAKKRSLVDAVLTATAASDCFVQDIEDLPEEIAEGMEGVEVSTKPAVSQPEPKEQPKGNVISEAQKKRLYAIAMQAGMDQTGFKEWLFFEFNYENSRDIVRDDYDKICKAAGEWKPSA